MNTRLKSRSWLEEFKDPEGWSLRTQSQFFKIKHWLKDQPAPLVWSLLIPRSCMVSYLGPTSSRPGIQPGSLWAGTLPLCKAPSALLPALQGALRSAHPGSFWPRNVQAMLRRTGDIVGLSESELEVWLLDTRELSSCPVQSSPAWCLAHTSAQTGH